MLGARRTLLVLDNLEQVLDAAPDLATLLDLAPATTLLATSRAPLRLSGERVYPLAPLALPTDAETPDLAALARSAAIALFMQRAWAARPDMRLSEANAPAIAEICRQLDGLPLALELAAARLSVLAPQALLERMTSRLALLTGGPRDAPARQQTLRATLAWSHDLLTADDQRLFRQLAVFVGGWSLAGAEAVCDIGLEIFEGHTRLVEQQLIRPVEQLDGAPRFTMLETLREYRLERLSASPEHDATRRRHAEHYLHIAEGAASRRWNRGATSGVRSTSWSARSATCGRRWRICWNAMRPRRCCA